MSIATGTQVGTVDCPGCGTLLPIKINAHGNAYFFCAKVLDRHPETGKPEKCLTRMNIGRTGSRRIVSEFLANKQDVTENVQHENRVIIEAAETNTIITGDQVRSATGGSDNAGGFGSALKHFFTGA